jgi:regulator of protease activity HflC (stomatin/prohibitin superfamily)
MTEFHTYDEERLAELLRVLPPAPEGWVKAAQELPRARREMDEIVARAEADQQFRAAVIADLESALEAAGYEVDQSLIPALKQRLASS